MRLRTAAVCAAMMLCAAPSQGGQRTDVLDPATGRRVGSVGESMPGSADRDFRDSRGRTRAILKPDGAILDRNGRRVLQAPQGRTDEDEWRPVDEWQGGQGGADDEGE